MPIHLLKYQPNWPTGGRAMGHGVWRSKANNSENHNFSAVFPLLLPHTLSHPNESSVVMLSPVQLLKFQLNRPTGGQATGRTVRQLKQKTVKIIDFFRFSSRCSRIPRRTKMKFVSSVAIPSLINIPKFQSNWLTGGEQLQGIRQGLREQRMKNRK